MSVEYPHAGALKRAVWCATFPKTPNIGVDRGVVPVEEHILFVHRSEAFVPPSCLGCFSLLANFYGCPTSRTFTSKADFILLCIEYPFPILQESENLG